MVETRESRAQGGGEESMARRGQWDLKYAKGLGEKGAGLEADPAVPDGSRFKPDGEIQLSVRGGDNCTTTLFGLPVTCTPS